MVVSGFQLLIYKHKHNTIIERTLVSMNSSTVMQYGGKLSNFQDSASRDCKHGGYKYEFIGEVPDNLFCQRCKCVARDPNVTSCCGEYFCKECISPFHRDNQPCPGCREADFSIVLNRREQRKISSLLLYCPMKNRGCEWTGRLEHLESHLNVQSGDCLYVDVDCPSHCNQRVQKRNVQNHLNKECPLREYMCPRCNLKASFKIISGNHKEECLYAPVQCPNRCGVTCERETLEEHIAICNKEELECFFSHAGCQGRYLRENEEVHMDGNLKEHLTLMATAMLKMSVEADSIRERSKEMVEEQEAKFQEKLQKQEEKFHAKLQELEIKFLKQEVKLQEDLQEKEEKMKRKMEKRITEIESKYQYLEKAFDQNDYSGATILRDFNIRLSELQYSLGETHLPPFTFTMPYFAQLKASDKLWYSPLIYTHTGGYSFVIAIRPNGFMGEGHGSCISLYYKAKPGDYDKQLKWPVTVTVTLQLLNQHSNRNHITKKISSRYDRKSTSSTFSKSCIRKFVSHEELEWDAEKETQYLKNDSLQLKVIHVEIED